MSWTPEQRRQAYHQRREALIERLGCRCVNCGTTQRLEFDHIIPADWSRRHYDYIARIKLYEAEASVGAIQLLCRSCNASKGDHQYLQRTFKETLHAKNPPGGRGADLRHNPDSGPAGARPGTRHSHHPHAGPVEHRQTL